MDHQESFHLIRIEQGQRSHMTFGCYCVYNRLSISCHLIYLTSIKVTFRHHAEIELYFIKMKKLKFIFSLILSVFGQTDSYEDFEEVELELKQGQIKGFVRDNVEEYRGVPFALPPLGNKRWEPSSVLTQFSDIGENFQHETECLQYIGGIWSRGEEDCLGSFL